MMDLECIFIFMFLVLFLEIIIWKFVRKRADYRNIGGTVLDYENHKWILSSDKLPPEPENDEYECYLVTIDNGGIYATESTYLYYYGEGEWIDFGTDISYCVVAWQPFPAAYRKTLYQRMLEEK